MSRVYTILNEKKQNIDQEYHILIEDYKKGRNISKLRDEAMRNFYKKLLEDPPALHHPKEKEFNEKIVDQIMPDINKLLGIEKDFRIKISEFILLRVNIVYILQSCQVYCHTLLFLLEIGQDPSKRQEIFGYFESFVSK
jgi:hypothetical protein